MGSGSTGNGQLTDGSQQSDSDLAWRRELEQFIEPWFGPTDKPMKRPDERPNRLKSTSMKPSPDHDAMRRTQWVVSFVGIALTAGAWGMQGMAWALGTLVGACLASMNLWVLARSVSRLLAGRSGSWAAVAGAKFLALLALTYLALNHPLINPVAFSLGLCALPLGIVLAGLFVAPPALDDEAAVPTAESDHA